MKYIVFYLLLAAVSATAFGQEVRQLTLAEAQTIAVQNNRLLRISGFKVDESKAAIQTIKSKYYPNADASGYWNFNFRRRITFDQGQFGTLGGQPLPDKPYTFNVAQTFFLGSLTVSQPITQLTKIATGVKVAQTDVELAQLQQSKSVLQIKQGVEKLYYGLFIAQKQKELAELNLKLTEAQLYDVTSALLAGMIDSVAYYGLQAQTVNQQRNLLQATYQIANHTADLALILGLAEGTTFELAPVLYNENELTPSVNYQAHADTGNIEIRLALKTAEKAALGMESAKKDFIPDLSFTTSYSYQNIINLLPNNNFQAGLLLSWKVFDWGTRRSVVAQRSVQQRQAIENVAYNREMISKEVSKSYRSAQQAAALIKVAQQALVFRQQELRFATNRKQAGYTLPKDVLTAQLNHTQAETDLLSAQLNYRIALMELNSLITTN